MNDPMEELFQDLSPPEGGLARLRLRLQAEGRREAAQRRFRVAAVVAASLVLLALIPYVVFRGFPTVPADRDLGRKVESALFALRTPRAPSEPFELAAGERSCAAALRVPTRDSRVAFYFLATCADGSQAPSAEAAPPAEQ